MVVFKYCLEMFTVNRVEMCWCRNQTTPLTPNAEQEKPTECVKLPLDKDLINLS